MNNTYLENAIEAYRKITSLDFTIYGEFVLEYLQGNGIDSLEDIELFEKFALYDFIDTKVYYKKDQNNNYFIEPIPLDGGAELSVNIPYIKSEVDKLNPSVLSGTLSSILLIIDFIKQIKNASLPSDSTNNEKKDEYINDGYIEEKKVTEEDILKYNIRNEYIKVLNRLEEDKKEALIYLALLKIDERTRNKIIETWNIQIFSFFSKSILNAEYLILDNYKERLDQIEMAFDGKVESENEVSRKIGRFYTEKAFLRVSWHLQEACSFIKRYLSDNQESNLLLVNSDRRKRFRRKEIYKNKYLGAENTKVYEALLESIIEMTIIDHYFRSDAETVEKLFHLYEQAKELKDSKILSNNELYIEVIDEVLAKVATMLDLILNNKFHQHTEPQIDVDYYYIINSRKSKDEFIENELALYCKRDTSENSCIQDRKNHIGKLFNYTSEEFKYDTNIYSDLKLYFDAVTAGIKAYSEQSEIISKIHNCSQKNCDCIAKCNHQTTSEFIENENRIVESLGTTLVTTPLCTEQEIVEIIKKFIDKQPTNLTPSFFRQVLEFISYLIAKETNNPTVVSEGEVSKINEYHALLKKVLNQLFYFLNKFVSDIPFSYRPYFENSFYSCCDKNGITYKKIEEDDIKDYKKEHFKGKFFFASIDCMPINYLYMSKLYNKYKLQHREQIYSLDEESKKNLANKFDTLSAKVQNDVNTDLESNRALVETKLEETSRELTSKNLEHMIVSLGVFAAFIAFVTISINLVRIAQNVWQYVIFSGTFTSCLLLFVFYLKHGENIKAKLGGGWNIKRILKYSGTALIGIGTIVGSMLLTSLLPVFNSEQQLRDQDSIINEHLKREKHMSDNYKLLLEEYRILKEKDSLNVNTPTKGVSVK